MDVREFNLLEHIAGTMWYVYNKYIGHFDRHQPARREREETSTAINLRCNRHNSIISKLLARSFFKGVCITHFSTSIKKVAIIHQVPIVKDLNLK